MGACVVEVGHSQKVSAFSFTIAKGLRADCWNVFSLCYQADPRLLQILLEDLGLPINNDYSSVGLGQKGGVGGIE